MYVHWQSLHTAAYIPPSSQVALQFTCIISPVSDFSWMCVVDDDRDLQNTHSLPVMHLLEWIRGLFRLL